MRSSNHEAYSVEYRHGGGKPGFRAYKWCWSDSSIQLEIESEENFDDCVLVIRPKAKTLSVVDISGSDCSGMSYEDKVIMFQNQLKEHIFEPKITETEVPTQRAPSREFIAKIQSRMEEILKEITIMLETLNSRP